MIINFECIQMVISSFIAIIMAIVAILSLRTTQKANKLIKKAQADAQKFEFNKAMPIINFRDLSEASPTRKNDEIPILLENVGNGPALNIYFETESIRHEDKQSQLTYKIFGWDDKLQAKRDELESFENLIIAQNNSILLKLNQRIKGDQIFPGDFLAHTKITIKYEDTYGNRYCSQVYKGKLEFKPISTSFS